MRLKQLFGGIFDGAADGNAAATVRLAGPLLLGSLAQSVYEFVNRIFLGQFSESALAAALPSGLIAGTFTFVIIKTIGYSATFVAQYHGADNRRGITASLAQGLWLSLFSLPLFLALVPVGLLLIRNAGHAPALCSDEQAYFIFFIVNGAFLLFSTVLGGYFSGQGHTRLVGTAHVIGCLINIALDPLLILVFRLGVIGAGIATVTASASTCALLASAAWRDLRREDFGHWLGFNRVLSLRILRFGFPLGISSVIDGGVFSLFTVILGRLGTSALALSSACLAIHAVVFNVIGAIRSAVQIHAGNFSGGENTIALRRATRAGLFLGLLSVLIYYATVIPFTDTVLGWFGFSSQQDNIAILGRLFVLVLVLRDALEVIQLVYSAVLRGIGDTNFLFFANALSNLVVWLPLFLLAAAFASPLLVWLSIPVYFTAHALLLYIRCRRPFKTAALIAETHPSRSTAP